MLPIELRQNKASMSCMLWAFGLVGAGTFCYLIFSYKSGINPVKLFLLLFACLIAFVVWKTGTKLKRDEPLLTFTREGLEINETQPILVLWQDIAGWDVRRSDATDYLIIKTEAKRWSINISWLQAKPAEVEKLMQTFTQPTANNNAID